MNRPRPSIRSRSRKPARQTRRRLLLESLEDRRLLATIEVTTTADTVDPDDGQISLREAIITANESPGADIVDATGISGTIGLTNGQLDVTDDITINGPGRDLLRIDANQNSRVLDIKGPQVDVLLRGLTLTGGRTTHQSEQELNQSWLPSSGASAYQPAPRGGGIRFVSNGQLEIQSSAVVNNHSESNEYGGGGGGIFSWQGTILLTDSLVSENTAHGLNGPGGGVHAIGGNVHLDNSAISNNETDGFNSPGGGISASDATVNLFGTTISGNRTIEGESSGGGISLSFGQLSVVASTVSGNSTAGSFSNGAGLQVFDADLKLSNSTIANNKAATADGGGLFLSDTDGLIVHSTIAGNTAGHNGGGIHEMLFFDLIPIDLFAVRNGDEPPLRRNSSGMRAVSIMNSIIAGNVGNGPEPDIYTNRNSQDRTIEFNLIGQSLVIEDPQPLYRFEDSNNFVDGEDNNIVGVDWRNVLANDGTQPILQDNGGPTHTIALIRDAHSPKRDAIEAGSNSLASEVFDQRGLGYQRVVLGDYGIVAAVDVGALEFVSEQDVSFKDGDLIVNSTADVLDLDDDQVTLRDAIALANQIDGSQVIDVTNVSGTITLALGQLEIDDNVTIIGPGRSKLIVDANQKSRILNADAYEIDVTIQGITLTGGYTAAEANGVDESDDTKHSGGGIRFVSPFGSLTLIDTAVIDNHTTSDTGAGGGIFSDAAVTTLVDSLVDRNSTVSRGGGIQIEYGKLKLTNTQIANNATVSRGGGINIYYGSATLIDSQVHNNTTRSSGGGAGIATYRSDRANPPPAPNNAICACITSGPIQLFEPPARPRPSHTGDVTLIRSTVSGNTTTGGGAQGGGIYTRNGFIYLEDSEVDSNRTLGDFASGGGISSLNGKISLSRSLVSRNSTQGKNSYGGGIAAGYGGVWLINSLISENTTHGADASGGGINLSSTSAQSGTISIINSTLAGNRTEGKRSSGGAIWDMGAVLRIVNGTIAGNSAFAEGGGIRLQERFTNGLHIHNSVIAGNKDHAGAPDISISNKLAGAFSIEHSLIGNPARSNQSMPDNADGNIIGVDWRLVLDNDGKTPTLRDNGGHTETIALIVNPVSSKRDAINAGSNALAKDSEGNPLKTDQRGISVRRFGGTVDMGAYERFKLHPDDLVVTSTADRLRLGNDEVTLRDAIFAANMTEGPQTIDATQIDGEIRLKLGQLTITGGVTIHGPGSNQLTINADSKSRVFNITQGSFDVVMSGLTVTGGKTTEATEHGGGIKFASTGTLTLRETDITANGTTGRNADGGGIRTSSGDVILDATKVSGNTTEGIVSDGGGIYSKSGTITVIDSTVTNNTTAGRFSDGGGINTVSGDVALINSQVTGNTTTGQNSDAGGIYTTSGHITLSASTVADNDATGKNAYGTGVISKKNGLRINNRADWRLRQPVMRNGRLVVTADDHSGGGSNSIQANSNRLWSNFIQPGDVNNDGLVMASDALRIINELARRRYSDGATGELNAPSIDSWPGIFFDQNGDGMATALDALRIVNELQRRQTNAQAEGEPQITAVPTMTVFEPSVDSLANVDHSLANAGADQVDQPKVRGGFQPLAQDSHAWVPQTIPARKIASFARVPSSDFEATDQILADADLLDQWFARSDPGRRVLLR